MSLGKRNDKSIGNDSNIKAGVYSSENWIRNLKGTGWGAPPGQSEWTAAGTYSWICPQDVTEISILCIGGGGGGSGTWATSAGGGGGLGWKNNYAVTPGTSYTVVVGDRGYRNGTNGGTSYFHSTSVCAGGYGGTNGSNGDPLTSGHNSGNGGGYTGDGGGKGGWSNYQGGGGCGGYNGNGGPSVNDAPNGGGGAGGGYYSTTYGTGAGGGTGIYGQRTDYNALTNWTHSGTTEPLGGCNSNLGSAYSGFGGQGGSTRTGILSGDSTGNGGMNAENAAGYSVNANNVVGGFPGGGGGGPGTTYGGGPGGVGAVRIMWGNPGIPRAYPVINCEDLV